MSDTSSTFQNRAQNHKAWWDDFQLAVVFLTRLPWRLEGEVPPCALNRAVRAFPLVGVLVGALAATVFSLAHWLNVPDLAAAFLAVLVLVMVCGGLHEDGLADVADGFGGGSDKDRKLEIMRDSTIGTYGALALIFSIGLRTAALGGFENWQIGASALIVSAALSRIAPAVLLYMMEPARSDGLAATMQKPDPVIVWQTVGLGIALCVLTSSLFGAFMACLFAFGALFIFKAIVLRHIGGQTGDVCGAAQQIMEITSFLVLVAVA